MAMIRRLRSKAAAAVFTGRCPKGFPPDLLRAARRKLEALNAAAVLDDVRAPPGNRQGQHSIRINDQWRICFVWSDGGADRVGIVDYHGWRGCSGMNEDVEIVASLPPMHPGEMLREEFMLPMNLSAGQIAKAADVPRTRIERIMREEVGMTGDTALRLSRVLGTSPEFWMNLQGRYELETARQALGEEIAGIKPIAA